MDGRKELGDRLRCLREKSGHTQQELAVYLRIDKSTYAHYETGRRVPDAERLRRLAQYYHLIDEILGVGAPPLPTAAPVCGEDTQMLSPDFAESGLAPAANLAKQTEQGGRFTVFRFPVLCPHDKIDMGRIYPLMQPAAVRIFDAMRGERRVSSIILFGSSVTQRCHQGSDLDLAVRLKPDAVRQETKNEVSLKLQESTDWNADILWYDRLSPEDRIYPEILKGVQIA